MVARDLAVDLTEGRRLVDESRAVVDGDVVREYDVTGVDAVRQYGVGEGTLVVHAGQRVAVEGRRGRDPGAEDRLHQLGRHHDAVDDRVRDLGIHRDGHVREQRPGRRRPHGEVRRAAEVVLVGVGDREAHVRALVDLVGVDLGLAQLVARERGAAARTVRDDLEVLVQESVVEELLEVPPHRLDVLRVEGVVGVFHVGPVPDALGEPLELPHERQDRFTTQPRELLHADLLDDRLLARDAELLLDLDLDGESVRVPAGATGDEAALHRLVATEQVLVDARPHVVEPGLAVRRGRALVEDPRLGAFAVLHRTREDVVRPPAGEFGLFESHKIEFGVDGAKHESP